MIRYRYVNSLTPPAPFVQLTVRCPLSDLHIEGLPALVDTAADRTVVPRHVITALRLEPVGHAFFQGFGGQVLELATYFVAITLHHQLPTMLTVTVGDREPFILLGRDVFNLHRLVLDGPNNALEFG